jgi:hypothetical protein
MWAATFGAAAVISVVYFVAAWLGLVLRPEPAHVAVFWPASGIAVGTSSSQAGAQVWQFV